MVPAGFQQRKRPAVYEVGRSVLSTPAGSILPMHTVSAGIRGRMSAMETALPK